MSACFTERLRIGLIAKSSTDAEVAPQGKHTEIEGGDRPHDIHDSHLLGVADLVDGDDNGADESDPQRGPRNEGKHVPNPSRENIKTLLATQNPVIPGWVPR